MSRPRHVVLFGLMGSGKSTVGKPLAQRLGRRYVDNDKALEDVTGRSAHEIAATEGIDALHRDEKAVFLDSLAAPEPAVISAPASAISDATVRERLQDHFVVWLDTAIDTLVRRFDDEGHRPRFGGTPREVIESQWRERAPLFRGAASYVVHGSGEEPPEDAVAAIVAAFAASKPGDGAARH
jgi:shikimate kinase